MTGRDAVLVVDAKQGPALDLVAQAGTAHAVIWPGMGAQLRSMHRISLAPGGRTREVSHPGEAVYYVIEGGGEVRDGATGDSYALVEGSMIHVDGGTPYVFSAPDAPLELVGGPAPADPALYSGLPEGGA